MTKKEDQESDSDRGIKHGPLLEIPVTKRGEIPLTTGGKGDTQDNRGTQDKYN